MGSKVLTSNRKQNMNTALKTQIAEMQKELAMREAAASRIVGAIPRQQNATAISRLYDALCTANIELFEAA